MFSLLLAAVSIIAPLVMSQEKIMDLAFAPENMVCAIEVTINEDLNRIPEQIKEIRCSPEPTLWCLEKGFNVAQCCHHRIKWFTGAYEMGCVELTDQRVVTFKDPKQTVLIDVAVGCVCGIAKRTPDPWRHSGNASDIGSL